MPEQLPPRLLLSHPGDYTSQLTVGEGVLVLRLPSCQGPSGAADRRLMWSIPNDTDRQPALDDRANPMIVQLDPILYRPDQPDGS